MNAFDVFYMFLGCKQGNRSQNIEENAKNKVAKAIKPREIAQL